MSLAIAGAIFENQAVSHVAHILPAYPRGDLPNAITGTYSSFLNPISSPATQKDLIHGIAEALSLVYIVVMVAGAVVTIIAVLLPIRKLSLGLISPFSQPNFSSHALSFSPRWQVFIADT